MRTVNKTGPSAQRKQFEEERHAVYVIDVISIDESSFWFDMKPGYGWAHKGRRCEASDNYKKSVRWTLLLAICNQRVYDKTTTSVTFATF